MQEHTEQKGHPEQIVTEPDVDTLRLWHGLVEFGEPLSSLREDLVSEEYIKSEAYDQAAVEAIRNGWPSPEERGLSPGYWQKMDLRAAFERLLPKLLDGRIRTLAHEQPHLSVRSVLEQLAAQGFDSMLLQAVRPKLILARAKQLWEAAPPASDLLHLHQALQADAGDGEMLTPVELKTHVEAWALERAQARLAADKMAQQKAAENRMHTAMLRAQELIMGNAELTGEQLLSELGETDAQIVLAEMQTKGGHWAELKMRIRPLIREISDS